MSLPYAAEFKPVARRKPKGDVNHNIECPECGVAMINRTGKHGSFYGCQRFPLCAGTRPNGLSARVPYDSFKQLLLDAHGAAVHYLAKPELLGKMGAVAWWLGHQNVLTDMKVLQETIEAASAKAAELGHPKDFLQEAYDKRMADIRLRYTKEKFHLLCSNERVREMPKPKFLRRWDTSNLYQLEAFYDKDGK